MERLKQTVLKAVGGSEASVVDARYDEGVRNVDECVRLVKELKAEVLTFVSHARGVIGSSVKLHALGIGLYISHPAGAANATIHSSAKEWVAQHLQPLEKSVDADVVQPCNALLEAYEKTREKQKAREKAREEFEYYTAKMKALAKEFEELTKKGKAEKPKDTERRQRNEGKLDEKKNEFLVINEQLSTELHAHWDGRIQNLHPIIYRATLLEQNFYKSISTAMCTAAPTEAVPIDNSAPSPYRRASVGAAPAAGAGAGAGALGSAFSGPALARSDRSRSTAPSSATDAQNNALLSSLAPSKSRPQPAPPAPGGSGAPIAIRSDGTAVTGISVSPTDPNVIVISVSAAPSAAPPIATPRPNVNLAAALSKQQTSPNGSGGTGGAGGVMTGKEALAAAAALSPRASSASVSFAGHSAVPSRAASASVAAPPLPATRPPARPQPPIPSASPAPSAPPAAVVSPTLPATPTPPPPLSPAAPALPAAATTAATGAADESASAPPPLPPARPSRVAPAAVAAATAVGAGAPPPLPASRPPPRPNRPDG